MCRRSRSRIRAIQLLSQARAVVLDHLSLAWSSDEIVALAGAQDVTLSWSLLAEGMDYVQYEGFFGAPVDAHGHGIILGDRPTTLEGAATRRISLHHNLWAHVTDRPPQLTGTCSVATPSEIRTVDAVHNVAYHWRKGGLHVSNVLGHTFANIEGNTSRGGPDTPDLAHAFSLNDWRQSAYSVVPFSGRWGRSSSDRT